MFPELLEQPFLLACSGGVDSVVLAHLCKQCSLDFTMAHCNFNLRGEESDGDERFVRDFALQLEKEILVKHFDTELYAFKNKVSIQLAARALRYDWFSRLRKENKLGKIVTAHHADDNLETFLINLSRGTGIDGLTGIPVKTTSLARPLLPFSRNQIVQYAKKHDLNWREDSSNTETKYLRNKIRLGIVPQLKELHPTFLDNFKRSQEYLAETAELTKSYIGNIKEQLFKEESGIYTIEIGELLKLNPLKGYIYNLFEEYGFKEWDNVVHLLEAKSGKEIRSGRYRLLKDREHLLLQPITVGGIQKFEIQENDTIVNTPIFVEIMETKELEEKSSNVLYVPKEKLKYPLVVRKRQKGDYFYPFGMQGKKKLSKFFKDCKMSQIAKEDQWLLCSGNDVVWIMGKRSDRRYRITEKTKTIVKFIIKE